MALTIPYRCLRKPSRMSPDSSIALVAPLVDAGGAPPDDLRGLVGRRAVDDDALDTVKFLIDDAFDGALQGGLGVQDHRYHRQERSHYMCARMSSSRSGAR